jgi:hypothetical protein
LTLALKSPANMALTYTPKRNECVVVLRDGKVIGTIRRYPVWNRCIVSVPGLLTASSHPSQANFRTINEAKGVLTRLELARERENKIAR